MNDTAKLVVIFGNQALGRDLGLSFSDKMVVHTAVSLIENRKLARQAVSDVNSGELVVICSNNDGFADELANLIRFGSKGRKGEIEFKNFGFPVNWLIKPENVKIYEWVDTDHKEVLVTERGFKIQEFVKERKALDMITKKSLVQ
jgi:hypothetical protein